MRDTREFDIAIDNISETDFNSLERGILIRALEKQFNGNVRVASPSGHIDQNGVFPIGVEDADKAQDPEFVKELFDYVAQQVKEQCPHAKVMMARRAEAYNPNKGYVEKGNSFISSSTEQVKTAFPAFAAQYGLTK